MALRSLIVRITLVTLLADHVKGLPSIGTQLRIVNGRNASVTESSIMAGIYYKGYFTCGGVILSERFIISAAHCVYSRDLDEFTVLTGTNDLDDPNGTETKVSQVIVNEGYQYTDNQPNDIALFRLAFGLEFDKFTQPVAVSIPTTDPQPGYPVTVLGWGYNKTKGNPMQILQAVELNTYSNPRCADVYKEYGIEIRYTNICSGVQGGGMGQCTGDSGGPILEKQPDGTCLLVGIISLSLKPCGADAPGVSTRVSAYVDWIQKHTS